MHSRAFWKVVAAGGRYSAGFAAAVAVGAAIMVPLSRPEPAAAVIIEPTKLARPARAGTNDCASCHTFHDQLSHPVGVRPPSHAPADLPLESGRMACITCHDADAAAGHERKRPIGEMFLRTPSAPGLCASCHTGTDTQTLHAVNSRAHLLPARKHSRLFGLDAESQTCLSCHDGAAATDTSMDARLTGIMGELKDHPIGVPHAPRPGRARDAVPLKPAHGLDPRIRLFDGALGCGSCHSVYAPREKLLVIDNHGSALCMSCHAP